MKKLIPLLLLFNWQATQAATFNSNATNGNWSAAATWSLTSGTDADGIPDADDGVTILAGHTVTVNNAQACTNLTVQGILTASTGGNLAQSGTTIIAGTLNLSSGVLDFSQVFALTGTASFNSGTYTFNSGGFSGTGTVTVASGTVNFNTGSSLANNLTVSGGVFQGTISPSVTNLTLSGGTFDPGGNATVSGTLAWSGSGDIGSTGGTASTVDITGAASISGASSKIFYKKTLSLNLGGSWTGGTIATSNSPVLNVPMGQALTFNSATNLSFGSSGTFNLAGDLVKQGSGTLTISAALNNTGAVDVQAGALALSGGGTHTGSFTVATAEGLQFNGGTHSVPAVTGGGSLRVGGGTVTLSSNLNMPLNMAGGTLTGAFSINTTTITMSSGTLSNSGSVALSGDFSIPGGTFSPGGTASVGGNLTLSGGTFDPGGNATVSGTLAWSGSGDIGSTGGTVSTVDITGAASISGASSKIFYKKTLSLNLGGSWTGGTIATSGSPVLNVPMGQALTFNSATNLSFGSSGTFNLAGDLVKQGSGTLTISAAFNNTGAVDVQAGALALSGGGTHTGSFTVATAEGLQFNGGTHSVPAVTGGGSLRVGGGTVTLSSNLNMPFNVAGGTLTGTFNINATTVTISAGTLSNSGSVTLSGDLSISGGTFSPSGTASVGGNLTLSGGTFDPGGNATVSGTLAWSSGGDIGSSGGTVSTVDITGAASISGASSKIFYKKTLNLNGGGSWTGGTIATSNSPVLNVPMGQALTFNSASNLSFGSSGTFNLAGDLVKQGSGTLTISAALNNTGAVDVQTGTLNISTSATHSGSFEVAAGATLNFSNSSTNTTVTGSTFTNNGTVTVPASRSLVFGGSAQQTLAGNGTSISALTVSNASDLNITGSQTVSGTLALTSGKVYLQNGDLSLTTLTGADASKYFVTFGTGRLVQPVTTAAKLFPIGPSTSSYNPVTLQQVSGTASFGGNVKIGFDYPIGGPDYVNRQWAIDNTGGSPNADVTLQWNSPADEQGGFTPGNCHISRWTGSGWQSFGNGAASCGSGICTRTQAGVTQFSPFGAGSGTALPVELVDFQALPSGSHAALLSWRTASELDSEGFSIEKSADGKWFESIGFVAGAGNSLAENSYAFLDGNFLASAYYRLRQVDFDGQATFSQVIFLETANEPGLSLFPNPAKDELTLRLSTRNGGEAEVHILDVLGKKIRHEKFEAPNVPFDKTLDVSGLAAGVYFLEIRGEGGKAVRRFVKQ